MKILTNNFWLKALAILCALSIWSYVYITESRTVKLPIALPIEVRGLDESLVAIINPEQSSVHISITAEHNSWQNLTDQDFIAYVDLTGINEGNYEVDVKVTPKNNSLSVDLITPTKITLAIEKASTKEVPIQVVTEGSVAEGLVVSAAAADTLTATIKGPKSYLDKVVAAKAKLTLNGEASDLSKNIALIAVDAQDKEVSNITISPKEVAVDIQIGKSGQTKLLPIQPKFSGSVATGKWLSSYSVTPSSLGVVLNENNLELKYIETETINIANLSTDKDFTVKIKLPDGVSLDKDVTSVKVSVVISGVETTKEQVLGTNFNGLTSLKVQSINPTTINGILSGSASVLASANALNSYINIDLSNYKSPGTYSIDLTKDMVKVPDGVSIVSFVPSAITVVLENK